MKSLEVVWFVCSCSFNSCKNFFIFQFVFIFLLSILSVYYFPWPSLRTFFPWPFFSFGKKMTIRRKTYFPCVYPLWIVVCAFYICVCVLTNHIRWIPSKSVKSVEKWLHHTVEQSFQLEYSLKRTWKPQGKTKEYWHINISYVCIRRRNLDEQDHTMFITKSIAVTL